VNLSLVSPRFVGVLGLLTAICVVAAMLARRRLLRPLAVIGAVVFLLLTAAAGVNEYFDYIPTTGALLGQRAADQASPRRVVSAVHARRRPTRGLVELVSIPPVRSGFRTRRAQVYLPPAWFSSPRPALPVVELLHGTPGSPTDWTRAGAADLTADAWAVRHDGVAPILVLVDENGGFTRDSECVGPSESYVVDDVHAWAVSTLGARADARSWAIGGSSEGGWCALMLGLRHPDRYATLLDFGGLDRPTHSGGALRLFGGSRARMRHYSLTHLLARGAARRDGVAAWLEVGAADGGTTRAVRHASALLRAHRIPTQVVFIPHAHHTWRVWRHSFRDAFPWVATRVGAVGRAASAPPAV
jgi:enterochelin esterase-like enzyme